MRHRDNCPVCNSGYPLIKGTENTGLTISCAKCGATLGLDNKIFYSYDKAVKMWNLLARRYTDADE